MCYKIFITNGEHKKCCQGGFPQSREVCLANCMFPAFPASIGENFHLLRYQKCLMTWVDGRFANSNASWTGKGIGNRSFISIHSFSQESRWFAEIALL